MKPAGRNLGQRERLVDGARLILRHRGRVDQHDWRAFGAKPCRQRLARVEQLVGGVRLEFAAEDPVLQVDQHQGGRFWIQGDHRRNSIKDGGRLGLRKMEL